MGKVEYKKLFDFLIFVENTLYPNILSILWKVTLTPKDNAYSAVF